MKNLVIIGLILLVVFILVGKDLLIRLTGNSPEAPVCKPLKIVRNDISLRISGRGILKPKQKIAINSKRAGQVHSIRVREGQQVTKGQRLIKIIPEERFELEFHDIQLRLYNAQLLKSAAEKNLERQRKLFSEGLVALIKVEAAEEAYIKAVRRLNMIKKQSKMFEKETGQKISDLVDINTTSKPIYTYITAPISGTIIEINTRTGENVKPNLSVNPNANKQNLLTVADLNQCLVEYKVNEIDINKLRIGQEAEIWSDTYPESVFQGTIYTISATASPQLRPDFRERSDKNYFTVNVLLKKLDPRLRPGMSSRIRVTYKKFKDIPVVPVETVVSDDDGDFVFLLKSGDYIRQKVSTGVSDENYVEIKSDLPEGSLICDRPMAMLEWEELQKMNQKQSILEKILN